MINTLIQKVFPPKLIYRNFIFIPLFFTFYIVLEIFSHSVFPLANFAGRSISIATYEGIDIGNRVLLFYKAIIFSLLLILLFTRLIIILKEYFNEEELKITNGISLAGFCLLFFKLLGAEMNTSINLIFALLLI